MRRQFHSSRQASTLQVDGNPKFRCSTSLFITVSQSTVLVAFTLYSAVCLFPLSVFLYNHWLFTSNPVMMRTDCGQQQQPMHTSSRADKCCRLNTGIAAPRSLTQRHVARHMAPLTTYDFPASLMDCLDHQLLRTCMRTVSDCAPVGTAQTWRVRIPGKAGFGKCVNMGTGVGPS